MLVIGGGGVRGITWALGVLIGLGDASPSPQRSARVVGTSASATVGVQLTTGRLQRAFDDQFRTTSELSADIDFGSYLAHLDSLVAGSTSGTEARRHGGQIGRYAIESATVSDAARPAAVAARRAGTDWPVGGQLLIPAVRADAGELVVLNRGWGCDLVDAIAASYAVPGIWPVVTIAGRRLMDGGERSACKAAGGPASGPLLVIVSSRLDERAQRRLERENPDLPLVTIAVDDAAIAAIGLNPFDPKMRSPAAGRLQGNAARAALETVHAA